VKRYVAIAAALAVSFVSGLTVAGCGTPSPSRSNSPNDSPSAAATQPSATSSPLDEHIAALPYYSSKRYDFQALAFPDAGHAWATADVWSRDRYEITGGAIFAATSGGGTWHRQESPRAWSEPSEIAFANDRCGWVLGSEDGHPPLLATTDGGATWGEQDASAFAPDADLNDIACADATHAWIVGDADTDEGLIWATTDSGVTWKRQALTTSGYLNAAVFADARHGWAVGDGVILATSDGGST
jgi:photosystem II stability/assembly factor-like uncharacterized protein